MSESFLESAVPDHLSEYRTCPRHTPENFTPPFPSYVARFDPTVDRIVMSYFGTQYAQGAIPDRDAVTWLDEAFSATNGPGHHDRARYIDEAGYTNVVSIAYWDDVTVFDEWYSSRGTEWTAQGTTGRFVEILRPTVDRYETLFSSTSGVEGVGALADELSGEIEEHGYWGGVRDRIALSQHDAMAVSGQPTLLRDGDRVRVVGHHNLCLIRSGQDWTSTMGDERAMYLGDVEPVLRAGMEFLRDEGTEIGCIANRYMTVVDSNGEAVEKSFGMSWWRSLAELEEWAASHPTHVNIFGAALRYLSTVGPAASVRLYHEVTVAAAGEQFFEYVGCHDRTGMLRSALLDSAQRASTTGTTM